MAWCLHTPNCGGSTSPPVDSPTPHQYYAIPPPPRHPLIASPTRTRCAHAVVLFDGRSNLSLAGLEPRCCSTFILRDQASLARHALTGEAKPETVNRSNGVRFVVPRATQSLELRASVAASQPSPRVNLDP